MARLGAVQAHRLGAHSIDMGVIENEDANSGYRDCSRDYMNLMEQVLRIDLDDPSFEIRTPLIQMLKVETMQLAQDLGVLEYLLQEAVSCYEGLRDLGCRKCPACILRQRGIEEFSSINSSISTTS